MSKLESLAVRLASADERPVADIERKIVDELEFHIAMRTEENIRDGLPPDDARRQAISRFGNFEQIRRTCRRALLGERIMLQRIQTVLTAMLLLGVVALAYQMRVWQQATRAVQEGNNAALSELAAAVRKLKAPASPRLPANSLADRPHVVETSPAHNAKDVDPNTAEIRVTFDKPMTDESWSWVRSSSNDFPESTGEVHYVDDLKTCVMPVQLEPGKKYTVWFNNSIYQNFKDADGRPAVPYLLNFTTRESTR